MSKVRQLRAMLIALVLIIPVCFPSAAFGADKDGIYFVIGAATCGAWHEAARDDRNQRLAYGYWLEGYISGVNYLAPGNDVKLDLAQINAYVDQYCANNPLDRLVAAANAMIDEAGGPKDAHKSKK